MIGVVTWLMLMVVTYCLAGFYVSIIRWLVDEQADPELWAVISVGIAVTNLVAMITINTMLLGFLAYGLAGIAYLMAVLLSTGLVMHKMQDIWNNDKLVKRLKS